MGHSRIGTLPKTRIWRNVVDIIANGADVSVVAESTLVAAQKALSRTKGDVGFREAVFLLAQLGVAAKSSDPVAHLKSLGVEMHGGYSAADLATALSAAVDERMADLNQRSDWGEIARAALVTAVATSMEGNHNRLFEPSNQDFKADVRHLHTEKGFGALGRSFFEAMSSKVLNYFLSKTLGTQIGHGQRFATMKEFTAFKAAMAKHCEEAAGIVESYSGQWIQKQFRENGGRVTRESAEGFGAHGIHKMQLELAARGGRDGN